MVVFEYDRLTGPSDYRLLKLQPGQGAEPLVSSLLRFSFDDQIFIYNALSYTWGNPNKCCELICNGVPVPITANLHSALQRVRLEDKPMMLWADAICINQEDIQEKEAQVRLMHRIFMTSYLVVADLGEAGDDYDDVATVFNALTHLVKTTAPDEQIDAGKYELFGLPSYEDKKWHSWRRFLARPWFSRAWVMQEYAVAMQVNMMYGTMQLHGEALPGLIPQVFERIAPSIVAGADSYTQQHTANLNGAALSGMLTVRQDIKAGKSRGLLSLLRYLSSFCEATDKRDKVYAFLGLATDAERSALYVSYSESTAEVYHRTAKVLIEQGSGIGVLYEAASYPHLDGLPSWAPNWAENRITESLGWTISAEGVNTFRATDSARSTIRISADGRLLHVRGIHLDTIEAIIDPVEEGDPSSSDIVNGHHKYLWDYERASRALIRRYRNILRYPPGERLTNALWRTLICDMTKDPAGYLTRPAPCDLENGYHAFLRLADWWAEFDPAAGRRLHKFESIIRESKPFFHAFHPMGRRFCVTRDGYMGLSPPNSREGDGICVFLGGAVPFVIRETGNGAHELVGECYVHGLMDGKALDMVLDVDWMEEKDITLE